MNNVNNINGSVITRKRPNVKASCALKVECAVLLSSVVIFETGILLPPIDLTGAGDNHWNDLLVCRLII